MSATRIRQAMSTGRKQASEVLTRRATALRGRSAALQKAGTRLSAPSPAKASTIAAAGGSGSAGLLVAEGDSWFDYPGTDVLGMLEDEFGYDIESVANKGDRVEDMAYGGGQLDKFSRTLERVLRRGTVPTAILLSGGGNDVAGDEFRVMLNHRDSPIAGIDPRVIDGVINNRIFYAYITIIASITAVCKDKTGSSVPILVHGYDYPVADGRGFFGGFWLLPGPWLEPGFREKGFAARAERDAITKSLIDSFNVMLGKLVALPQFQHVSYVDLRHTLPTGASYKDWWDNELHPTRKGFRKVAARFAAALP
jgi:hypothetical protein